MQWTGSWDSIFSMTFNVISKWVLFPPCTSFSFTGVQLYCTYEADWGPLTCRGPLKDGVLSSGPWIVISWRNLLWICVVANMMKFHQSVRKLVEFALFKAFSCDFFLWMIAVWVALSHLDVFVHIKIFSCLLGYLLWVTLFQSLPSFTLLKVIRVMVP